MAFKYRTATEGASGREDPIEARQQQAQAGRDAQMRKISKLIEANQKAKREEYEQLGREEREGAMRWGDDATRGASTGLSMGGPWGALIGGIAGTVKGQARDITDRSNQDKLRTGKWTTKKGDRGHYLHALGKTLFDLKGSIPSTDTLAGAAQTAGPAVAGMTARKQGQQKIPPAGQSNNLGTIDPYAPASGSAPGETFGYGAADKRRKLNDPLR
jgi:hypothetical protein